MVTVLRTLAASFGRAVRRPRAVPRVQLFCSRRDTTTKREAVFPVDNEQPAVQRRLGRAYTARRRLAFLSLQRGARQFA